MRRAAAFGATAVIASCLGDPPGPVVPAAPVIDAATVAANPRNALSAVVSVGGRHVDNVAVRFHLAASATGADSVTPAVPVAGEAATVPVLGLLPARRYVLRAVAYGGAECARGAPRLPPTRCRRISPPISRWGPHRRLDSSCSPPGNTAS
jgi:hypothetical protein